MVLLKLLKKGAQRYTELAKETDLSPGGLSKVLRNLQKKGLVKREQKSDEYPPPVLYYLTEYGVNVAKDLAKRTIREKVVFEIEDAYVALRKFDPKEADDLLQELERKLIRYKKM
jgi:DNA-binding HxlR family transcriptional regulator